MQNEDDRVQGNKYVAKDKGEIVINGVRVNAPMLMSLFMLIFDPDSEKWYRFVKQEDKIMIQVAFENERQSVVM